MTEAQMMATGYVFFVLLIAGEAVVSVVRKDNRYRLGEAAVNVGHGMVFQVWDSFTKALVLLPFLALAPYAPVQLPVDAVWGWVIGLLAYDFCSYWAHRHHHEIALLWGIHSAHHAAEDFNFAAALRQALFQNLFKWAWKLPLALFMPFEMLVGLVVFDYLYQFVQHTQYVPKLGPIEWVMNTPSHHRVHHGRNEKYLDKNYGGILIIWDRLFGTFQVEEEEADFGITRPLHSLNPVWANVAVWAELAEATQRAKGWDKLWVWLKGPADTARLAPGMPPARPSAPIENDSLAPGVALYTIANLGVATAALGWLMFEGEGWPLIARIALGGWVVLTTLCLGARIERKPWVGVVDGVRAGTGALAFAWFVHPAVGLVPLALLAYVELAGRRAPAPAVA
ncbi:MAG: sterol desaturase family protein [Deltaproteobacteria bacterium]|nr:MAG: sterol desaturase family protein [Deltaproteobacteria bacterium]